MDLITDTDELRRRVSGLESEEFVTVDTEFYREKTYYPKLCLVQLAGEADAFAVDVLVKKIDLTPLFNLLSNTKILKVFHSLHQDIEILLQYMDEIPSPLFDTQIAAQMLGYGEAASYAKLVDEICGIDLDKTSRYTDWTKRPLSQEQINYAISDVTHLRQIYSSLVYRLDEIERRGWVDEEMQRLFDIHIYQADVENIWRRLKLRSHKPRFLAIVKELAKWRELYAQRINKPREWVLRNELLMQIAATAPATLAELKEIRAFNSRDTVGREIIRAIERGLQATPPDYERKKPLPPGAAPLMDLLKVLLKLQSETHQVAASVIARTDDLKKIAVEDKPDTQAMRGWRYDIFGKYAIALKAGKLSMTADGSRIVLVEG